MKHLFLHKYSNVVIALVTVLLSLLAMGFYTAGTLNGNMDNFFLSAERFGTPSELADKGIKPLYHGNDTGWDGQFYYYISNDLLGLKDTPKHIDSPSYRYQRIGLPLYTKVLSLIAFQDWVSPSFYYYSYLLLIAVAAFIAASFFKQRGFSPWYVFLWSLGIGTQVTLMNGLPDAAADAFMILAIIALMGDRWILYTLTMVFSVLSREAYIIIPFAVCVISFLIGVLFASEDAIYKRLSKWLCSSVFISNCIIGACFLGWQVYIYSHFNASPGSQAHGILGFPFVSWYKYILSGIQGKHLLVGANYHAYVEAGFLFFFMILCLWVARSAVKLIKSNPRNYKTVGLSTGVLCLVLLYFCFGPTVIMHYTGYMKAANLFLFILPLFVCLSEGKFSWIQTIFLLAALLLMCTYFWISRVLPLPMNLSSYTNSGLIVSDEKIPCFSTYAADLELVNSEKIVYPKGWVGWLFGKKLNIYHVKINNKGEYPIISSTQHHGSFALSGQMYIAGQDKVSSEGFYTYIPTPIMPNEERVLPFLIELPKKQKHYVLKISLIQEGCAWVYNVNKDSVVIIDDPQKSIQSN